MVRFIYSTHIWLAAAAFFFALGALGVGLDNTPRLTEGPDGTMTTEWRSGEHLSAQLRQLPSLFPIKIESHYPQGKWALYRAVLVVRSPGQKYEWFYDIDDWDYAGKKSSYQKEGYLETSHSSTTRDGKIRHQSLFAKR